MMYSMTAKQALRKFDGKNSKCGQAKLDAICADLGKKYGIKVSVTPCINEEKPSDNFLNAVFEYDAVNHVADKRKAFEELEIAFENRGLAMEWECGGDGNVGPIESYRIELLCQG